jgi:uncharacterized membrane protein YdbT with pleckstrin-like domain
MSIPRDQLLPHEEIRYATTLHWAVFLRLSSLLTLTLYGWYLRATHAYVVTSRRVVVREGWWSRETLELLLNKVETVEVEQDFWGRLFGYGVVEVCGTGGTHERFHGISDPLAFRRAVHEAADALQSAPAPERPTAQRLADLDALRSAGTITEAEYAETRARILDEV